MICFSVRRLYRQNLTIGRLSRITGEHEGEGESGVPQGLTFSG